MYSNLHALKRFALGRSRADIIIPLKELTDKITTAIEKHAIVDDHLTRPEVLKLRDTLFPAYYSLQSLFSFYKINPKLWWKKSSQNEFITTFAQILKELRVSLDRLHANGFETFDWSISQHIKNR